MTEKNIFAYKLFLSWNISDFNLFFMWQLQPPLKKVTPSFPATLLQKLRSCPAIPFWKFGWRFKPLPPLLERGGCTLWAVQICTVIMLNNWNISKKIYLAKHFVQKSGNSKYYNVLNSKLHYEYLSAYLTKYSEHNCLLNHLQEHILPCQ